MRRSSGSHARRDIGTWDIGPFDNDTTADFAGDLDEAGSEERETMIRGVLKGAADPTNYLDALPTHLRTLTVDVLDQGVSELSELAALWAEAANGSKWRQDINRLRNVLDPPIPPQ
ncbi:DUF4259 domain-containing protein [Streptomyces sp. NPDC046237]|uniref:DUF4259 domain-containing protein n=1 Tax=Streptomyces sp. NPDC046237 TaxID=3154914 RepID=UPI00340E37F4